MMAKSLINERGVELCKLSNEPLIVTWIKHVNAPVQGIPFNHVLIHVSRLVLLVREAVHEVGMDHLTCGPGRNSFLERCPEVLLFIIMNLDPLADFCERLVSFK